MLTVKASNPRGGVTSPRRNRRPAQLHAACAAVLALMLIATSARSAEDNVAKVLDKLPADAPAEKIELRHALISLTPGDIARLCVGFQLAGEDLVIAVIVGDAGDDGCVGGKSMRFQCTPVLFVAAGELAGDVLGVGS